MQGARFKVEITVRRGIGERKQRCGTLYNSCIVCVAFSRIAHSVDPDLCCS